MIPLIEENDLKKALEDIQGILNQGAISFSDLVNVMVKFRIFLEAEGAKKRYRTLSMYCDWVVHPKLDRSSAREIVEFVNDAYLARIQSETAQWISDALIEGYKLHVLHDEIQAFAKEFGLNISVFDMWENWEKFAWALIHELQERPSELSKSKTEEYGQKYLEVIGQAHPIVSVFFAHNGKNYIWVATNLVGASFIGDMAIVSQEMVDKHPSRS